MSESIDQLRTELEDLVPSSEAKPPIRPYRKRDNLYGELIRLAAKRYLNDTEDYQKLYVKDEGTFLAAMDSLINKKIGLQVDKVKNAIQLESTMLKQELKNIQEIIETYHLSLTDTINSRTNEETKEVVKKVTAGVVSSNIPDTRLIKALMRLIKEQREGGERIVGEKVTNLILKDKPAYDHFCRMMKEEPPTTLEEYKEILKTCKNIINGIDIEN